MSLLKLKLLEETFNPNEEESNEHKKLEVKNAFCFRNFHRGKKVFQQNKQKPGKIKLETLRKKGQFLRNQLANQIRKVFETAIFEKCRRRD